MDYKAKRALNNGLCLFVCILLIGLIWQLLEIKLYGYIQHRKVDDIINLFYVFAIYCAYWRGVKHGIEDAWIAVNKRVNNLRDGSKNNNA